ncbi:hypothetical protein [Marinobacter subterrani]|uniref:Uncharacterized protein n=1 Tax=Marinobacter subterrani TaxID=1658765 RepID=A0A0J7M2M4_9GAMM|nr:hypothetical protein [Marinobacter subterrani]KMQ75265.1 hypothetical protein Msub_11466 [Marinobacter subterrani]
MLIASYEQWREAKKQVLEEENPAVPCEECDGFGHFYSVCPCCDSELDKDCEVCKGAGEVYYLDSPKPLTGGQLINRKAYFQEVIADLKKWSAYTKQDFLHVAGRFVDEFRRGWVH